MSAVRSLVPVLHSPGLLQKRAVMRLTFAAMIASAILAPLILGSAVLAMGSLTWDEASPADITAEMLCAAMLAMFPAACLGGLAMHRGAALRSESSTLGWAALGGVLFLGASVCCAVLASANYTVLPDLYAVFLALGAVLLTTVFGAIVSGPMGFAFGLLFLIALSPITSSLTRPSIVTPADALRSGAVMLLVASGVALVCASTVQIHVAAFAHGHLALDTPWLAFALFPLPLALVAFVFELTSLLETRTILRMRDAMLIDAHPEYHPGDISPEEDATPLTELDRLGTNQRLLVMRASSAYRDGSAQPARVYVALASISR